jgi:hypothetical protein
MARETATGLVQFTRKSMGNPTTDEWSNDQILRLLNWAQVDFAMKMKPRVLATSATITTTSGTSQYATGVTDLLVLNEVRDETNNNYKLRPGDEDHFLRVNQTSTTVTGYPTRFYEAGESSGQKQVVLYQQIPGGTYTIRLYYTKKPTEIVLSPTATSPVLSEELDFPLVQRAAEIGLIIDREYDSAGSLEQFLGSFTPNNKPEACDVEWLKRSPMARFTRRSS